MARFIPIGVPHLKVIGEAMTKGKVIVVNTRANNNIEYKVLNSIGSDMGWLKWSIIFLFLAILCPVFLKSLGVVVVEIVAGVLAAIGIGIFACLVVQSHFLGNAEAKLVKNAIKDIVTRDAEGLKQKVVKVKFCSDSLDSYGTIDEEYVLALLSNKTVLKYPIRQLNRKDDKYNYKLIVSKSEACENEKQKEQILRESLILKLIGFPLFISFITWVVIVFLLGLGVGIMYLFVRYVHSAEDMILPFVIIMCMLAFIPLYELTDKRLPHNRLCDGIRYAMSIPLLVLSLTKLVMPSITIMATLLLMFAYSFLPVFAVVALIEKAGYDITMEGKLFVLLTIPLIIATHCSDSIRRRILRKSPFYGNDHHYHLFMRELVRFVYTKENLNFIVYASYFLFLFVSTFKSLQSGEPLLSADIDMVVAKSFLVFIACTNMLDRKKSANLEGGELLSLFVKMMIVHDDEEWRLKRKKHQLEE